MRPDFSSVARADVGPEMPALAGSPGLSRVIHRQLESLAHWAGLSSGRRNTLEGVWEIITRESLDRPAMPPYRGLSCINASGLPFQWVFRLGRTPPGLGFLAEVGRPGDSTQNRLSLMVARMADASRLLKIPRPVWIPDLLHELLPRAAEPWPGHWRSAMWMGVAVSRDGIQLKPYFNLNRDSPRERWLRVGRILKRLGREHFLPTLCQLAAAASQGSWPVGLTVDILPDGSPGRLKIYFRSESVRPEWLERWYHAAGFRSELPHLRTLLDAFPRAGSPSYSAGSFILSIEFHPDGKLGIKTDLAITKWQDRDGDRIDGTQSLVQAIGGNAGEVASGLEALDISSPTLNDRENIRFVSLGSEPDLSQHVNLYVEPPIPGGTGVASRHSPREFIPARPTAFSESRQEPRRRRETALRRGLDALADACVDGHWTDFELPVGKSHAWVTAYVLARLADVPDPRRTSEIRQCINAGLEWLIQHRTPDGGWGYNECAGDDADSTAWSLLALRRHGRAIPPSAVDLLVKCIGSDGCLATFAPGSVPGGGWTLAAPDVTAVALQALEVPFATVLSRIGRWPRIRGLIPAYWWISPFYTTAALLDPWPMDPLPLAGAPELAAVSHIPPANAFDAALKLISLTALQRNYEEIRTATRELMDRQKDDGLWPASAFLRLTSPEVIAPWATLDSGPIYQDLNAVFTTATAVSALSRSFKKQPQPTH